MNFHIFNFRSLILGAVDGTHIRIMGPLESQVFYFNRKRYHSINVQAVCDSKKIFTNVVAMRNGLVVYMTHAFLKIRNCVRTSKMVSTQMECSLVTKATH